jgi:3-methylfumaryl-CoA hydratase
MAEIDIAHLRTWIGRGAEAQDVLTRRLVEDYRATFEPHLAPVADPDHAPLAMQWCLAPGAAVMASLSADGLPTGSGFMPDVPLPRRMWAGGEISTFGPIPVGETVVRRSTIADMALKRGRTGQLLFVSVDHDYLVGDSLLVRDRQDAVYREAAREAVPAAPPAAARAPEPADQAWTIEPSAVLLFRYSALTFNSHRIHYDRPYATAVEGYDGLIVHGPLQGSFAFNLAAVIGGRAPARFAYRNLTPLVDDAPFQVRGRREPDGSVAVWTEDHRGRQCMRGLANWS